MTEQDRERWTKLVADFETSDLTQREFASARGISFSNLRNWIYKLRRESRPLAEEASGVPRQEPAAIAAEKPSRLLPVRVVASAPKARRDRAASTLLELVLPAGAVVRFSLGTDPSCLRALLAAL